MSGMGQWQDGIEWMVDVLAAGLQLQCTCTCCLRAVRQCAQDGPRAGHANGHSVTTGSPTCAAVAIRDGWDSDGNRNGGKNRLDEMEEMGL